MIIEALIRLHHFFTKRSANDVLGITSEDTAPQIHRKYRDQVKKESDSPTNKKFKAIEFLSECYDEIINSQNERDGFKVAIELV